MDIVPFPLIIPVDDENKIYQGYLPIHNIEYYLELKLGPNGYINGEQKLLYLINEQKDRIYTKLKRADEIMSYLTELKELLEERNPELTKKPFRYDHDRYTYIYKELRGIGFDKVYQVGDAMNHIIFQTIDQANRQHLLKVILPIHYPFALPQVISELPSPIEATSSELSILIKQHQILIEKYQTLFNCLDELDTHMRILEPEQPKRNDIWRRIALGHHCSLEIELNPESPMDSKPKVRFFGSLNRVNDLKNKWNEFKWDKNRPIYQNLLNSFQLVSNSENKDLQEDYTMTGDIECGICYSYKLNDKDTPDIICDNLLCNRGFHYPCLYEWLRGNPATVQSFNILFGKCPYCNEKITIKAKLG
ncbi:WD-repeat region-domain-containing protein [Cokeromyces recurvatus]|uniref:WD-repeat region-domain-containing protein n=1 Tax=Cokeromyces recurvatus TaxID=90255 RepID=UPI00221E48B8|nr:WD-repeat region-domain-containing protein [Cokeromyces recurvatus]KAI7901335.1 WD-repeat region-domain-containing protein [Cokeromyces recurvatus]